MSRQNGSPHMPRIMSQLANTGYPTQAPYPTNHQPPYPMQQPQATPQHFQHQNGQSQQQETSFITAADTEAAVTKINTMFPTANDAHIRLLLKK